MLFRSANLSFVFGIDISKDNIENRLNGACARYLNFKKTNTTVPYALFVNGNVVPNTIFGRDSGANRCLMRQFVKLNKGDVLTVRNWESNVNPVHSAENAGGHQVGVACIWSLFMLDPLCSV